MQERKRGPVTEERLVRAVEVLAQIVREHGAAFSPLYETVEQDLHHFRRLHQVISGASEQASVAETSKAA